MRQILGAIFRALFGRANSKPISAEEFTQECAKAFSEAGVGLQVSIVRDLELRMTVENGQQSTSYLDNLYETCRQQPKLKREAGDGHKRSERSARRCSVPQFQGLIPRRT